MERFDRLIEFIGANAFLNLRIFGNSMLEYIAALVVVAGFFAAMKLYSLLLSRRLRAIAASTTTNMDDLLIDLLDRAVTPILFVVSLNILPQMLALPAAFARAMHLVFIATIIYFAVTSILRVIDSAISRSAAAASGGVDPNALNAVKVISKIILWIIGILLLVRNLGYDITSVLAGMGIAGVAVALAVQNILGDIFSYISILIDRPFEKGDFIVVGADKGTVENIGLRSTRLRSLEGQELVIHNADLTASRINNFKKMERRRTITVIGVEYATSTEKLRAIPTWIAEIVRGIELLELERANLKRFGESSIDFEMSFFVNTADYNLFMILQEKLNLALLEKFRAEGVSFAFPTQTVILRK